MTGKKKFSPLDPEEARMFENTAEEIEDTTTSLTGRSLSMLGLRSKEFHHMVPGWLIREGSHLTLLLRPYTEIPGMGDGECFHGSGEIGQGNPNGKNLFKRGKPCTSCRSTKGDNVYLSKSENAPRDWAMNSSPELQRLGEDLEWYFEKNKHFPFGGDGVRRRVWKIAERAGLDDEDYLGTKVVGGKTVPDMNAYDLRHTYGIRLARMEWEPYEIQEQMGHADLEMPKKYISFAGKRKEELMDKKWDPTQY
jgi:hypothetical protein